MLTPEQQAKIHQKELSTPDALKRDTQADYREGYFFVTLNTRDAVPILSTVEGHVGAPAGTPDAPHCHYTGLGEQVIASWRRNSTLYPCVEALDCEAMPEHFHGLIHLMPGNRKHLGQIIKGFMIGCSHAYWDMLGIPWRDMPYEKGVRTPQYNDRDHTRSFRGPAVFVHGYNDVEAITPEQVEIKKAYIRDQALKRLLRGDRHECFTIHRDQRSSGWTPEAVMRGLCADQRIARTRFNQIEAWQKICTKLKWRTDNPVTQSSAKNTASSSQSSANTPSSKSQSSATASTTQGAAIDTTPAPPPRPVLDLVGNGALLQRPMRTLICHRADSDRFEQQKAAVLKAAREGAVIVTACISPKEHEVMLLLQKELLPVIVVMDNGFNDRYKPTGKAFYATAELRRLEVTPWEYEYQQRRTDAKGNPLPGISREMCMVMNELVRLISHQREDTWWKNG